MLYREEELRKLNTLREKYIEKLRGENVNPNVQNAIKLEINQIEKKMTEFNKLNYEEKQIHVIWIGKLPKDELNNLKVWAKFNKDFKINIWTDTNHILCPKLNSAIKKASENNKIKEAELKVLFYNEYQLKNPNKTFDDNSKQFLIEKLLYSENELESLINESNEVMLNNQKEIATLYTCNEVSIRDVAKEWKDLFSNDEMYYCYLKDLEYLHFAASASDILRCVVLNKEGGVYLDTDTMPKFNFSKILEIPKLREEVESLVKTSCVETGKTEYNKTETIINELLILHHVNKTSQSDIIELSRNWTKILGGALNLNLTKITNIFKLLIESNLSLEPIEVLSNFPINNHFSATTFERAEEKIFSSFLISKKDSWFLKECLAEMLFCSKKSSNRKMIDSLINQEKFVLNERGPYLLRKKILELSENFFYLRPTNITNFCSMSGLNSINSTWFEWNPKQKTTPSF